MSLPRLRRNQNNNPPDLPEEPERLPLRWVTIIGFSIIGGCLAGTAGTAEAALPRLLTGVTFGLAILAGLHKIVK